MLIDKEVALKEMCEMCYYHTSQDFVCRKCNVYELLEKQPAVEAEPVRHGHWIWFESEGTFFHLRKCSECGDIKAQEETNFCPNCGAKMKEED